MNQSVLLITDFDYKHHKPYQVIDNKDLDLGKLFQQSKDAEAPRRYGLAVEDPKRTFKALTTSLKQIKAAGGLVQNGRGQVLFIFRLGKWDLPKGKVDDGEKVSKAAVREVEEETGIKVAYKGPHLANTYHLYKLRGELVIKKTAWYYMGVNKCPKLVPQKDEDITKAVWVSAKGLKKIKENTYLLVKHLVKQQIKRLPKPCEV